MMKLHSGFCLNIYVDSLCICISVIKTLLSWDRLTLVVGIDILENGVFALNDPLWYLLLTIFGSIWTAMQLVTSLNLHIVNTGELLEWYYFPVNEAFARHIQYHGCWCAGDTRGQGFKNHDIGDFLLEYRSFSTGGLIFVSFWSSMCTEVGFVYRPCLWT